MSKTKIATIVCLIVTALVLSGLVTWFIFGPVFNRSSDSEGGRIFNFGFSNWGLSGPFEVAGTHSVPVDDVTSLSIDWTAGRVTVTPHHGNDIQITEFSQRALRDGEQLRLNVSGGTVSVNFIESRVMRNMPSKQLEVLIPYTLAGSLDDVTITTVSGRVELSGIQAQTVSVRSTSGRVEARYINAVELDLRSVSGRVEVFESTADTLNATATSGRLYLSGEFDTVTARSVSGRVEFISAMVPASLSATTTSGRISVIVPAGEPISVQQRTTSGRFTSDIPIITGGGADAQFNLSSTSGRIEIFAW
ncbi:MAG: DUF4097 domain-containing protein [Oscillospiraceae bacterium]|nr:DUF4097 domain-containing protein [Oscillospiraceae bacterium]